MIIDSKVMNYHDPFQCKLDIERIGEPKQDEIQCRSICSLISIGSECISFARSFHKDMHRTAELGHPQNPGYSVAAEVIAVGRRVKDYKVGDLVYAHARHRSHFNIKANFLVAKAPEGLTAEDVCWTTVFKAGFFACLKCEINPTSNVVILGQGLFGVASLQFARLMGARRIIVIDPIAERAERAYQLGATHVITGYGRDSIDKVVEIVGRKADCSIDCTSTAEGMAEASMLTRNGGNVALIADPPNINDQRIGTNMLKGYLSIHGIFIDMMTETPNAFFPMDIDEVHGTIFEAIESGKLKTRELITRRVSPADATEVYAELTRDRSKELGVLYDWSLV